MLKELTSLYFAHFGFNDDIINVTNGTPTIHPTVLVAALLGILIIATIAFQFYYQAKKKRLQK